MAVIRPSYAEAAQRYSPTRESTDLSLSVYAKHAVVSMSGNLFHLPPLGRNQASTSHFLQARPIRLACSMAVPRCVRTSHTTSRVFCTQEWMYQQGASGVAVGDIQINTCLHTYLIQQLTLTIETFVHARGRIFPFSTDRKHY